MSTVAMTTRQAAPALAREEYAALLGSLRSLPSGAWSAPTDCVGWTVRDIVAHLAGAAEESARMSVFARHYLGSMMKDRGRALIDRVNDAQLADRRSASPEQLIDELQALAPRAVRGRERLPGLLRRNSMPAAQGFLQGDTLGYLMDVIYTRDVWMHRVDIARATGTSMVESSAEAEVVAQVVRDLSRSWTGTAFMLVLTGRVSGTWRIGCAVEDGSSDHGARITVDAVELCRTLSGRSEELRAEDGDAPADLVERLRATRIVF